MTVSSDPAGFVLLCCFAVEASVFEASFDGAAGLSDERRHAATFNSALACIVPLGPLALLCRRGAPKGLEGNFKWGGFEIIFEV